MDFSANIQALGNLTPFQLIVICSFGLFAWYIYIDRRETKQINNAVNHKADHEPTLREAVMQIRQTLNTFIATTEQSLKFGDQRITALENKVFKK